MLEPVISNWLYPEEEPQIVVLPEDQEEMSPEEMLAENLPTESPSPEVEQEELVLEKEQIDEILSGVVLDRQNYKEIYAALSDYVTELNHYMVTVTAVTSNIDWFNTVQEKKNQTSGVIITDNGKELLILTDASYLSSAESLTITFYTGDQVNAQVKQTDNYTNLAVLTVPLEDLPAGIKKEKLVYPTLGSSNTKLTGMPVIAMGSPMGTSNSIGYGMITSASTVYSVPDNADGYYGKPECQRCTF